MKYRLLLALGFAVIIIASCKKDKVKVATNTELLSSSVWKYDTSGVDSNNDGTMDTAFPAGTIEACAKDNTATFVSNGTGTADEGASKCDDSDPQTTPFTWVFSTDEKKITFSGTVFNLVEGEVTVLELTNASMQLSKSVEVIPGYSATVIIKLKH